MKPSTFLIVDVSNLGFRSYYAHPTLSTSKGRFSGSVYGSVSELYHRITDTLKDYQVTLVFAYDGFKAKASRQEIYPEYKGNRTPHEVNPIPDVVDTLRLWPGIHIKQDDKEGDDAICRAVQLRNGKNCCVLSGDKDLYALRQYSNCEVYSPNLKRFVTQEDIQEQYLLEANPEKIYLAKALFGDSSDNIKGCFRLLKKHVAPLLNDSEVKDVETFYAKLGQKPDFMSDNTYKKLLDNRTVVERNYQVILPRTEFVKDSIQVVKGDLTNLKKRLIEFECYSLIEKLDYIRG